MHKSLIAIGVNMLSLLSGWRDLSAAVMSTGLSSLATLSLARDPSTGNPGGRPAMHALPLFPDNPIVDSEGVGYLAGDGGVDSSGHATYSIALAVPSGVAGMQPELSLNYVSGGRNGMLGLRWSLSGFSQIMRCRKTLHRDAVTAGIEYKDTDAFRLNGEKLVAVTHPETWPEYRDVSRTENKSL